MMNRIRIADGGELVNSSGEKLVCVVPSNQVYHEIDTTAWRRDGTIIARCASEIQFEHGEFREVPISDLGNRHRACRWHQCGGPHMREKNKSRPHEREQQLKTVLDRLTPDQFDRIVDESGPGGILHGK